MKNIYGLVNKYWHCQMGGFCFFQLNVLAGQQILIVNGRECMFQDLILKIFPGESPQTPTSNTIQCYSTAG